MIVYIMTVILTAVRCCLSRDPVQAPFRVQKREREKERKRAEETNRRTKEQKRREKKKEKREKRKEKREKNPLFFFFLAVFFLWLLFFFGGGLFFLGGSFFLGCCQIFGYVQIFGCVYRNTNGPNHGPVWKTQLFLLTGICTVIPWQDCCGKGNLRRSY